MGTWKFTAHAYDIKGNHSGTYTGQSTGPDPVGAIEAVRQDVIERTSAWRAEVHIDAPEFD